MPGQDAPTRFHLPVHPSYFPARIPSGAAVPADPAPGVLGIPDPAGPVPASPDLAAIGFPDPTDPAAVAPAAMNPPDPAQDSPPAPVPADSVGSVTGNHLTFSHTAKMQAALVPHVPAP